METKHPEPTCPRCDDQVETLVELAPELQHTFIEVCQCCSDEMHARWNRNHD